MIVRTEAQIAEEGPWDQDDEVLVDIELYSIEAEIQDYAKKELDLVEYDDVDPYGFMDEDLIDVLENRGYRVGRGELYYPNNSFRITDAYNTLLENVSKVPVEEIENLIKKYNLI